jgi:hypothetical protein
VLPASRLLFQQANNQIGTMLSEMACDEHGYGDSAEYCGDNDARLGRINVFYHES